MYKLNHSLLYRKWLWITTVLVLGTSLLCFILYLSMESIDTEGSYEGPVHCSHSHANDPHVDCFKGRTYEYCSFDDPSGLEGMRGVSDEWILHHVIVNVRHGDRTSLHTIDGAKGETKDGVYRGRADVLDLREAYGLSDVRTYELNPLDGDEDLKRVNPLETLLSIPDRALAQGQLTSHGFKQLLTLGAHLRSAYKPLVDKVAQDLKSLLAVRSTNYDRTIQSAAGLVAGMFPGKEGIPIAYHPDEKKEVMLGSVRHGDSRGIVLHENGEATNVGCERAKLVNQKMKASGYPPVGREEYDEIVSLFGEESMAQFSTTERITDVVDAILPRYCHGEAYQCGDKGQCVTHKLLESLMEDADRAFCEAYTSPVGGREFTMLDMFPFMKEVRGALLMASETEKGGIQVFAGHDTVIAPVLSALGVYGHPSICAWPPYASRITFELWTPSSQSKSRWYIRLMYNGKDVTGLVPSCQSPLSITNSDRKTDRKSEPYLLCPMSLFFKQIDTMLHPHTSLTEACEDKKYF